MEEPCYLKYGDKEGAGKVRKCIDLSKGEGEQEVIIPEVTKGKMKNFKLKAVDPETNKLTSFKLKAENKVERDEWVDFLRKALLPYSKKMSQSTFTLNEFNEMPIEEQKASLIKQMSHIS